MLPALLLAACGDDEGGSGGGGSADEKAITKVLQDGLTSKDPKVTCSGSLSTDFMQRVYGGEDKCVSVETENAKEDKPAESVEVSDIEVNGDKATATVEIKGGDNDGSKGPIDLVKQGEDWRVNDLSVEFLRSQLETAVAGGDEDLSEDTLNCVKDKLKGLDDAELKKVAYGAIGEQQAAQQQFVELVTTCDPSLIRDQIEAGITDSLKQQGASEKQIECVKDELKKRISDEQLNQAAQEGGDTSALQKSAAEAAVECGVGGS
jgi:hypothetical protein